MPGQNKTAATQELQKNTAVAVGAGIGAATIGVVTLVSNASPAAAFLASVAVPAAVGPFIEDIAMNTQAPYFGGSGFGAALASAAAAYVTGNPSLLACTAASSATALYAYYRFQQGQKSSVPVPSTSSAVDAARPKME